jgi:hypothetical protein
MAHTVAVQPCRIARLGGQAQQFQQNVVVAVEYRNQGWASLRE